MPLMLCRNLTADFNTWKAVFASHADAHRNAGLDLISLWPGLENPDEVFFLFRVASMERAHAFIADPAAVQAGQAAGALEGEYHFLDEPQAY